MSTNYVNTFISVSEDSTAEAGQTPPRSESGETIAEIEHELLSNHPYAYTSDELLFEVFARRKGLAEAERDAEREAFLAKDQACLRASPLSKRYGWGTHHDAEGRVALVGVGTQEYAALQGDDSLTQKKAMRSSRAK